MASGTIKTTGSRKFQTQKTSIYSSGTIDGYASGNVATLYISVLKVSSTSAWQTIAVIPSEYRPKISMNCTIYSDAMAPIAIYIGANGNIQSTGGLTTSANYSGVITYVF